MNKLFIAAILVVGLVSASWALMPSAESASTSGSCCARTTGESACALTGNAVDSCCCVVANGQLVCTLTGETLSECCCGPQK